MDNAQMDESIMDIILKTLDKTDHASIEAIDAIRGGNFGDFLRTVELLHIKSEYAERTCAGLSTPMAAQRCNFYVTERFDSYSDRFAKELMNMCM